MAFRNSRVPLLGLVLLSGMLMATGQACATVPNPTSGLPQAQAQEGHSAPISTKTAKASRLAQWAKDHRCELSYTVTRLRDASTIVDQGGNVPRNPASVTKILTARVALEVLRPSFQFTTGIYGKVVDGRASRLVIRGSGDPTLSLAVLREWVAELIGKGLREVEQQIVVDQSRFEGSFVPPAFEQQPEEWAAFRAPVCATSLDRNRLTIRIEPATSGRAAQVTVLPPGVARVSGEVQTVSKEDRKRPLKISLAQVSERMEVHLTGTVAESAKPVTLYRRVEDPNGIVGSAFAALLRERGVRVPVPIEVRAVSAGAEPLLLEHESDALSVVIRGLGKESDNFTAEMLLRAIGRARGAQGSSEAGAQVLTEFLGTLGTPEPGTKVVNGSGLFDANRLSTRAIVRVLTEVRSNPALYPEFASQLSTAGSDGTLRSRLASRPEGCTIRAKTGTLRNVSAMAGYVDSQRAGPRAFAVILEGEADAAKSRAEIDEFVASLCNDAEP